RQVGRQRVGKLGDGGPGGREGGLAHDRADLGRGRGRGTQLVKRLSRSAPRCRPRSGRGAVVRAHILAGAQGQEHEGKGVLHQTSNYTNEDVGIEGIYEGTAPVIASKGSNRHNHPVVFTQGAPPPWSGPPPPAERATEGPSAGRPGGVPWANPQII